MTDEILDNSQSDPSATIESNEVVQTADSGTIINPSSQPAAEVKQTWPDNWREVMAGGDEKELKRLQRLASPEVLHKSYRELENIKARFTPPPKAPTAESTPEEVKAYREHHGIPEDPSKYDLTFDDGTVIGDDIKPVLDGFLKFSHEKNLSQDIVKSITQWYMNDLSAEQERVAELNYNAEISGKEELKAEWGGAYQGNINAMRSLFTDAPEGTFQALDNAYTSDGLKITNQTGIIRWMVDLAKKINPTASLLPSGANDSASIDTELAKLQSQMHSKDPVERDKYWKSASAQERFVKLTQAKQNTR